ncbi:hypothetical protein F511_28682 [Dorcoceras hygrometricum]|uniref:Uncharacterized protein n=1 Tax=Dorcoceras hygrometricum TaxID=472368 RepID=A0A2Z7D417_9LAMI|nr:hypothetical protein F511_28682 [Dorcoceras hygrometricum]
MLPTTNQTQQSSRNYPVATIQSQAIQSQAIQSQGAKLIQTQTSKRSVSTKPDDVALLPRLVPQFHSRSSSRNTISSRDWFFNSSTGHSLTSATTVRRNTSATTDFPFPPAASYSNHQIPNPTSRWLQYC